MPDISFSSTYILLPHKRLRAVRAVGYILLPHNNLQTVSYTPLPHHRFRTAGYAAAVDFLLRCAAHHAAGSHEEGRDAGEDDHERPLPEAEINRLEHRLQRIDIDDTEQQYDG